jgi:hypothetical protein
VEFFKIVWFCALFGQFPAFFDVLIFFKKNSNFLKIFEKSKNAGNCLKSAQNPKFLIFLKKI